MCGRYLRRSDKQKIAEAFHTRNDISTLALPPADYNIAPSTFQPVIRNNRDEGTRELVLMRWGMIPHYARSVEEFKGFSTINARAESIRTSPTWRKPFKKRRCLVPVSGFYEWQKIDAKTRKPYVFTLANSSLFAFAGLWDAWKDKDGHWLQSFSIVTTEANKIMSAVHTRMPVILHSRDYDRWLSRVVTEQPPIDLLRPFESDQMEMSPANQAVGNVRNNGPEMLNSA